MVNSVDPDQTLHSVPSDLGPHCLKGLSVPILMVIMVSKFQDKYHEESSFPNIQGNMVKKSVHVCVWVWVCVCVCVCICMSVHVCVKLQNTLTLKALLTTAADDILNFYFVCFQRKYDLPFHVNCLLGR